MSNLLNKAKDAMSGNKTHDTTTTSTTHGTHGTHVTHGTTGHHGNTTTAGYDNTGMTGTTGTSGLGHGTSTGTTTGIGGVGHGTSTNAGPHDSNMMNKLDPRVDSDRDGRNDPTSRVGGYGQTQGGYTGTGATGAHATTGTTTGLGSTGHTTSTNAGPHNSNMMNKLDPRVDSDRDGRNDPASRVGGYGQTQGYSDAGTTTGTTTGAGYGNGHSGTTTGAGYGTGHSGVGGVGHGTSTNAGPHNSNMMNKVDPRIDSDRDGRNDPTSRVGGYGQTQDTYGTTGTGVSTGKHTGAGVGGTTVGMQSDKVHNSSLLNKLDPRTKTDSHGNPI